MRSEVVAVKGERNLQGVKHLEEVSKKRAARTLQQTVSGKRRERAKRRGKFVYKEWWEKNRSAVLKKRKARYETDPEYRDLVKEASAKSRERQRAKKRGDPRYQEQKRINQRRRYKPRVFVIDGQEVKLMTHVYLLEATGLNKKTLTSWFKDQIVPVYCAYDSNGWRWYPEAYIEFMAEMSDLRRNLAAEGGPGYRLQLFKRLVWGKWVTKYKGRMPDISRIEITF